MINELSKLGRNNKHLSLTVLLGMTLGIAAISVFAAGGDEKGIAWGEMIVTLLGGLALFLFGMEQMADALKAVAGERMKMILAKLTTNRFMGALTGAFVTAVIQSSSVTTVLVVGFISAGLMSLQQSVGVIMGANIGTTITAQIVAFKITKAALAMVAIGFGMLFLAKREKIKHYGEMLMGLGLVFFGMNVMGDAMNPLRSYQPFLDFMVSMENPLIGILASAAFTGLIQSSSATTGIVIVMAGQGFITLPAGIALAFGANIGTCVTALLACIGKPREAVRAAIVHLLFNVFGVLVWVWFIGYLADFVTWISPSADSSVTGSAKLAAETPRQIANAHTFFNVANTVIFIGFVPVFVKIVEFLVPARGQEIGYIIRPKYLDDSLIETPSLALDRVKLEIGHMGERVKDMLAQAIPATLTADRETLAKIATIDDEVDILHGKIVTYLAKISRKELTTEQTEQLVNLIAAVNDLENIGDIVETNLTELGNRRLDLGITIHEETKNRIMNLHGTVSQSVNAALRALVNNDPRAAREVVSAKARVNALTDEASMYEINRLIAEDANLLPAYIIGMDVIGKMKRIYYFAKKIAKSVIPVELVGKSSD